MPVEIEPAWTLEQACEVADLRREVQMEAGRLAALLARLERSPYRGAARSVAAWHLAQMVKEARHAERHLAEQAERAADQVEWHVRSLTRAGEGG